MAIARLLAVAALTGLGLVAPSVAWAKGGPPTPPQKPAPAAAAALSGAAVKAALDVLLTSSPWDGERPAAGGPQPPAPFDGASFADPVPHVGGGSGVELAVSDPGSEGLKGKPKTAREAASTSIRGVADGTADWALAGRLSLAQDKRFRGAPLASGGYVVSVRDSKGGPSVVAVLAVLNGKAIVEMDVAREGLARVLDSAAGAEAQQRLAQAAVLNFVAARLDLADRLDGAVKAVLDGGKPEPCLATNLNSSKSNIYRVAGSTETPVALATTVKGAKSNSSDRRAGGGGGVRAVARYAQGDPVAAAARVAKGEAEEAGVGSLVLDRDVVLPAGGGVELKAGTYDVGLLDGKHHKTPGKTDPIIVIARADGTVAGGVAVNGPALARQLMTAPPQEQFAKAFAPAVVLNVLVAALEEKK